LAEGRGSLALKTDAVLAGLVLTVHVAVILFNLFGLIAVPLGAWRGWSFVRIFWWRALHLAALAVVALQAVLGRACFLTLWQDSLLQNAGETGSRVPLIQRWVAQAIFWPLPVWFFALLYVTVWIYAIALWRIVPPRRFRNPAP
jgi:hypothetical protein